MLTYLIILLDDTATSYCHYSVPQRSRKLISFDNLKNGILFAMKENLTVQFVYPDYDLPKEYEDIIETVEHVRIKPSSSQSASHSDIVVFETIEECLSFSLDNSKPYVVRVAKENLFHYRYDSYALFIWKLSKMISDFGLVSMVTGDSWLTLSSFAQMRKDLIRNCSYKSVVPLGSDAFEAGFGTVMFTFGKKTVGYKTVYYDMVMANNKSEAIKKLKYEVNVNLFVHDNDVFLQSNGAEFVYPCTDKDLGIIYGDTLSNELIPKAGLVAGSNDLYLRLWYELDKNNINLNALSIDNVSENEWVPLHKGGGYRKWYGIHEYVIHLLAMFSDRQKNKAIRTGDPDYFFKEGITWSTLSNKFAVRRSPIGFTYNTKGSMCFPVDENKLDYYMALLNSKVSQYFIKIIAPNLDFNSGTVVKLPGRQERCDKTSEIAISSIRLSKEDWDSFETSWDFKKHPLI